MTLTSGVVNCNGSLFLNSGVSLSNSFLPTTGQLGSQFAVTSNTGVGLSSTVVNKFTITNLSIGVWIITGAISCFPNVACVMAVSLSPTSVTVNSANIINAIGTGGTTSGIHFTWTLTNATTASYYITATLSGSATANTSGMTQWATCTRIG